MHYVVGDIHGCYKAWIRLKNRIEKMDLNAQFILIGDIVDRGPEVIKMVRWAMDNISADGKYQMIMGNHEVEKIEWMRQLFALYDRCHDLDRAMDYVQSDYYDFKDNLLDAKVSIDEIRKINKFFMERPFYKEIDLPGAEKRFIVVHGGIDYAMLDEHEHMREASVIEEYELVEGRRISPVDGATYMIWDRKTSGYPNLKNTVVINGHTPTITARILEANGTAGKIFYAPNSINIDCGMTYYFLNHKEFYEARYGNLAAVCLETMEEFYSYKR